MRETQRLILREWTLKDREPFFRMNSNPEVMRHFPNTMSREESDELAEKIERHLLDKGYGLWACERKEEPGLIGFVGLSDVLFEADFTPAVEIGWRLDSPFWGHGYATEAAREALRQGFLELKLERIISFTYEGNAPSRRVMEKLGMKLDQHFMHPKLPGHPLETHVLYHLDQRQWKNQDPACTPPTLRK